MGATRRRRILKAFKWTGATGVSAWLARAWTGREKAAGSEGDASDAPRKGSLDTWPEVPRAQK